jgi:hypothetical protein
VSQHGTPGRTAGAVRTARYGYDRAIDVLERLVPIAARLERVVRAYGIAVGIAAAIIVATVLIVDLPGTVWTWGLAILFIGALLVAPIVILLFASMLREALTLPAQFRSLPDIAPARARELATIAREAKDWRQHERAGSIPRDSWRAARLLNALRKAVPGVSVVLSLARVPFLILVGVALLVGFVELALAPVVVVVALVAAVV